MGENGDDDARSEPALLVKLVLRWKAKKRKAEVEDLGSSLSAMPCLVTLGDDR